MRSDLFVLAEEEAGLKVDQTKKIVRNYKDISLFLAILFLAIEGLGLIASWTAEIALFANIVLGLFVLYRAAIGIFTLDIVQEILPKSKKEEIPSWQYIGRVAIAVGGFLFLLMLRAYVEFESMRQFGFVVIALIVGTLLLGMGTPQKK